MFFYLFIFFSFYKAFYNDKNTYKVLHRDTEL